MRVVSVVIPVYNREDYLPAAIDSVLSQKLPRGWEIELIIADDGSTDSSAEIIKSYGKKVKPLLLRHSGKPATPRNAAIKAAKGQIIAFQDSDDLWADNKLLKQLPAFDDPNIMLSFGQAEIIDASGKKTGKQVVDKKVLANAKNFADLLQQNPISTLTVMARKEAILSVGGFNEADELRAIEDYDLWLRIAARYSDSLKPLKDILAYYRRHDQNISQGDTLKGISDAIRIYNYAWHNKTLTDIQRSMVEKYIKQINITYNNYTLEHIPNSVPELSVVMSVYNGEKFLNRAIDSILTQSFKNFEFIIIDDGCTDKSEDIINSYKDSRIRLIHQANHGLVASLNVGLDLARGEYIARMDADDISLPKRFERELTWLKANNKRGLVSTFFEHIDHKSSKPIGTEVAHAPKHIDLRRAFYTVNPFAHGASMFRKTAVLQVGRYRDDYGPTEDYDLWRRVAKKWQIGLIPEVLFQYRINNPNSVSQAKNNLQSKFIAKIHDELWSDKLVRKNPIRIWLDYKNMSSYIPAKHIKITRAEYIKNQLQLYEFGTKRGKTLFALQTLLGLYLISPSVARSARQNVYHP